MGLLRTLLFLLAFYYITKLIRIYVLPLLMKKGFERMQQQQQNAASSFREQARKQEGKVTIKKNSAQKKSQPASDNDGEYVDFEEVN